MNSTDETPGPGLEEKLAVLLSIPERDGQAARRGREVFLAQAQALAGPGSVKIGQQAVSTVPARRLKGWIESIRTLFDRKERSPMFISFVSLLVAVSMVLGGGGAAVAAAQSSLPGQPLYGLKTWSENARLELTGEEQERLDLSLQFAWRRVEELRASVKQGLGLPEPVLERLRQQLDLALQAAGGLDDDRLQPALERARLSLHMQDQALLQLQTQAGGQASHALDRAREMVQQRLEWVDEGLRDPQSFRQRIRQSGPQPERNGPASPAGETPGSRNSYGPGPYVSGTPTPGSSYGPGPGPNPSATPASNRSGPGPGPYITGTPTPGSSYGPGPGPNPSATPASGNQSGPGPRPEPTQAPVDGQGYGPGPSACCTATPGSGSGPGPGPAPESTCTPQDGDGHHHGGEEGPGDGGSGDGEPGQGGAGSGGGGGRP